MRLVELEDEIVRQDQLHGRRFDAESELGQIRLGVACLEDEAVETRNAWREERKVDGWAKVREEALQTAAVALRLVRQIDELDALRPTEEEMDSSHPGHPSKHVFVPGRDPGRCIHCGKSAGKHVQPAVG